MFSSVGERRFDQAAVAIEVGELSEDGGFEPVLGQPVAVALARAVLAAGGAGVVGVAAVASVGGSLERSVERDLHGRQRSHDQLAGSTRLT